MQIETRKWAQQYSHQTKKTEINTIKKNKEGHYITIKRSTQEDITLTNIYAPNMCSKSLQLCPVLCSTMDCRLPGSSVHGNLQEKILEQVAIPSSTGSSKHRDRNRSLTSPALAGGFFTTSTTWEAYILMCVSEVMLQQERILKPE